MSPEERRMLTDLFDRVRGAADTPRDRDAEDLIAQKLREQPYAAYFLAQAVIVQDQALQATTNRLHELEDQVRRLEADDRSSRHEPESGGFLNSLGSLFGNRSAPDSHSRDGYAQRDSYAQRDGRLYDDYSRANREPEPNPGPWGRNGATGPWAQPAAAPGGFLRGALTTAAGVAGGVLVADTVRDMFSSHWGGTNANPVAGLGGAPAQETVNNYFVNDDKSNDDKAASRDDPSSGGGTFAGDNNNDDNSDDGFDVADYDDGGGDDSYV